MMIGIEDVDQQAAKKIVEKLADKWFKYQGQVLKARWHQGQVAAEVFDLRVGEMFSEYTGVSVSELRRWRRLYRWFEQNDLTERVRFSVYVAIGLILDQASGDGLIAEECIGSGAGRELVLGRGVTECPVDADAGRYWLREYLSEPDIVKLRAEMRSYYGMDITETDLFNPDAWHRQAGTQLHPLVAPIRKEWRPAMEKYSRRPSEKTAANARTAAESVAKGMPELGKGLLRWVDLQESWRERKAQPTPPPPPATGEITLTLVLQVREPVDAANLTQQQLYDIARKYLPNKTPLGLPSGASIEFRSLARQREHAA